MSIVKKTALSSYIESPEMPINETTIGSVQNKVLDIPVGNKDELHQKKSVNSVFFFPKVIVD